MILYLSSSSLLFKISLSSKKKSAFDFYLLYYIWFIYAHNFCDAERWVESCLNYFLRFESLTLSSLVTICTVFKFTLYLMQEHTPIAFISFPNVDEIKECLITTRLGCLYPIYELSMSKNFSWWRSLSSSAVQMFWMLGAGMMGYHQHKGLLNPKSTFPSVKSCMHDRKVIATHLLHPFESQPGGGLYTPW